MLMEGPGVFGPHVLLHEGVMTYENVFGLQIIRTCSSHVPSSAVMLYL